eukprot:tig00000144_g9045.t1
MAHEHLLPPALPSLVESWLREDIPSFDVGGYTVGENVLTANLLGKGHGVLAGVPFFNEVFRQLQCEVTWLVGEGEKFAPITKLAIVRGKARHILMGERTGLNILARACGIATVARKVVDDVRSVGWKGSLAGTRKTTPGFRLVEKYALVVAGADTHRMDLSCMIMLKDNHIAACGSIPAAIQKARSAGGFSLKIEVECSSVEDAKTACKAGADIVMLDNLSAENLKIAAKDVKTAYPSVLLEASGGITPDTVKNFACDNVDIISLGCLTQGVPTVDISLKICR